MDDLTGLRTPYYLYDLDLLKKTVSEAAEGAARYGYSIHYAIKANNDPVVSAVIRDMGLGADCVSGNEIRRSLEYGFSPGGIVFAGVGKTDDEIKLALAEGIFCLNVESVEELEVIRYIADLYGMRARVALRVNPSVEAETHQYITTGLNENKFGISLPHLRKALEICAGSDCVDFMGLHFHIGSQITSLEPYRRLCERVSSIWKEFGIEAYGGRMVNLGGGLGIDYNDPEQHPVPDFSSFFAVFNGTLDLPSGTDVRFELGRSLVGQCGRIVTKVLYTKQGVGRNFVITDAGMTELMRPSLYQATHRIKNINSSGDPELYDVVGPVCESTDVFGKDILLPATSRGDLLQILSCGAYAQSMSLDFNLRDKPQARYSAGKRILSAADLKGLKNIGSLIS
ncbi:MAG: diaminopimelate decarboxylase [Marinilabiliales bacterium]|nr:MAG: diaminopimelate decarboxylase [Marinilabiliales bacterium]